MHKLIEKLKRNNWVEQRGNHTITRVFDDTLIEIIELQEKRIESLEYKLETLSVNTKNIIINLQHRIKNSAENLNVTKEQV